MPTPPNPPLSPYTALLVLKYFDVIIKRVCKWITSINSHSYSYSYLILIIITIINWFLRRSTIEWLCARPTTKAPRTRPLSKAPEAPKTAAPDTGSPSSLKSSQRREAGQQTAKRWSWCRPCWNATLRGVLQRSAKQIVRFSLPFPPGAFWGAPWAPFQLGLPVLLLFLE